jgi:eukaryotic-like serine/threonine-protein kinase
VVGSGIIVAVTDILPGRILAGRYRLVSRLGRGGMGSVWRAFDQSLEIDVAIKLIDPDLADTEVALARFRREAFAAAKLRSSHIVHITDYGVDDDTPYIAMDLLEGESLGARLATRRLTFTEVVAIVTQVGRALGLAHDKGIVHRDLKPDNIFLTREGEIEVTKVLDFGVAKRLDASSFGDAAKTRTGTILGTPYYMSPEQAHGRTVVDQRADIWSLGVIVYECVTGRRPFEEQTLAALLLAICSEALPIPSQLVEVPAGFDEWFARATARDLDARFQTASEAVSALGALAPGGIAPRLSSSPPVTAPGSQSSSLIVAAGTAGKAAARETVALDQTAVPSAVTSDRLSKPRASRRMVGVGVALATLLGIAGYWLIGASRAPATDATGSTSASNAASVEAPRGLGPNAAVAPDTSVGATAPAPGVAAAPVSNVEVALVTGVVVAPVPSVKRDSSAAHPAAVVPNAIGPSRSGKRAAVSTTDDKIQPAGGATAPPTVPNISGF